MNKKEIEQVIDWKIQAYEWERTKKETRFWFCMALFVIGSLFGYAIAMGLI